MEMAQEQRLQLKIKFLLGCNMKTVALQGDKNLLIEFFLVEEDYPRLLLMMEI